MSAYGPLGLNVAEMNNLIGTCRREAQRIRSAVQQVSGAVDATWWKGLDADRFRTDWTSDHRQFVLGVADTLDGVASVLSVEVQNQILVSND
jgi:hypothetical protein